MDENDNNVGTLLQRKRKTVKVWKEEKLLILRAYLQHPTRWSDILDEIRQNLDHLTADARILYETGSLRQLRDRMSGKLGSLVKNRPEQIQDEDIRNVVTEIQDMERRLQPRPIQQQQQQHPGPANQPQDPEPAMADVKDQIVDALSSSEGENEGAAAQVNNRVPPLPQRAGRRRRKRPLADLIRENHEHYNRFIKNKVPKLLRQLGVSSTDEDE